MDNLDRPLVTVGIPFYNSDKYLFDAIKSTVNQTYSNLEIILINDGSLDSSLHIAKGFEKKDKRITIINDNKNVGLPKRLNQLSRLAKGKYYARMDADDIMFPNRIEAQVEYLTNNPKVDLLGTGLISIDNNNNIIGLRKSGNLSKVTLKTTLQGSWAPHPSITGKTKWFKENEYDENLLRSQDFELWIRTVEKSNFASIKKPLLFYREASTSSVIKYIKSTKYSLQTFWKNRKKTGISFLLLNSLIKLSKLVVYIFYFLIGSTKTIIHKRSLNLSQSKKNGYIAILNKSLS